MDLWLKISSGISICFVIGMSPQRLMVVGDLRLLAGTSSCVTNAVDQLQTNRIFKKLENRWIRLPFNQIAFPLIQLEAVANSLSDQERLQQIALILRIPVLLISGNETRDAKSKARDRERRRSDFMTSVSNSTMTKEGGLSANANFHQVLNRPLHPLEAFFASARGAHYASAFVAPGRTFDKSIPVANRPLFLVKDFSDKTAILLELTNALIWRQRSALGLVDPWALSDQFKDPEDYDFIKDSELVEFGQTPALYVPKLYSRSRRYFDQLAIQFDAQWLIFHNYEKWGLPDSARREALENMRSILGSPFGGGLDGSVGLVKLVQEIRARLGSIAIRSDHQKDRLLQTRLADVDGWLRQRESSVDTVYRWLKDQN